MQEIVERLKASIRDIPNFPKEGIVFKDITTLIKDKDLFKHAIDLLYERYKDKNIDVVVCIESRGFIFGGALAYKLGAGLVPVRKPGKLPHEKLTETYELEYGTDTLEIHKDAVLEGHKVLIIDDLLATGGTVKATAELIKKLGGQIVEMAFLIELSFLSGRNKVEEYDVFSIIQY